MSFTRLDHDDCTYKHVLAESRGPGTYMIGTPRNDCTGCFFSAPGVFVDRYGAATCSEGVVDVDSEVMNITRRASRCPSDKYIPGRDGMPCKAKLPAKDCSDFMGQEDTRLSNPPCTLRGTGWNRWEFLCRDPQESAFVPFDININNRMVVKDNHRPCIPEPIDQSDCLPPLENIETYVGYSPCHQPFVDVVSPQLGSCRDFSR